MSGYFDEPLEPPAPAQRPAPPPRSRALLWTVGILVLGFMLLTAFTGIWTDRLWYASVDYSSVFNTLLLTRVGLFAAFGLAMAAVVCLNIFLAWRFRPLFRPASLEQANLDRYREVVDPIGRWVVLAIGGVMALFSGASASGEWRQYLLWRNGGEFGQTDPYFGRDIGFYMFDLPWLHYLVDFAMAAVVISLLAAAAVHYLYGGIRLQSSADRFSGAAHAQTSVLLGVLLLLKAADYWLDRFDLTVGAGSLSGSPFTGMRFTDENAVLPSKNILMFISIICALILLANVFRRTWLLPAAGMALLALSAVLLGLIWPGVVQNFQVSPSEPDKEEPYIRKNIEATRAAYAIDGTEITAYPAKTSLSAAQLRADASTLPGIRLQDPAAVADTFQQKQQVRGYYSVPRVLDVDRYQIDGEERDLVVAVRELNQDGLPDAQKNWSNRVTVYTHGYGMIAAYGNQRNAEGEPVPGDGEPVWAERDVPPFGELTDANPPDGYRPQIYFGEQSPEYSIVGKAEGGRDVELDIPEVSGAGQAARTSTYDGEAGVPVGGLVNQLLYGVKFSDPTIVLSNRVNENSKILYDRSPIERVEKVAPWLTVDSDPFPAAVDGRIVWILDGYTLSDMYPLAERRSLREMTSDTLNPRAQYATLATDHINYMRNAVKATVDAYDGTVTLYEWDQQDPVLKAWQGAFPGTVKRRDEIPDELLAHMRYPEDMFKVQRNLLASYHVTNPRTFYEGNDKWEVPQDPNSGQNLQPPYRLTVSAKADADPVFSLTSVYVPSKRQNLASFISVDADASQPDYGQLRILRLPSSTQVQGPSQIANAFGADEEIQQALLPFTRGNSRAVYGNLLTLPVGDGLLYVQPLYTLRQGGSGTYPVLRFVLVSFGDEVGYGQTLSEAIDDVLGTEGVVEEPTPEPDPGEPGEELPRDVRTLLQQADEKFTQAEEALRAGDLARYQRLNEEAQALVAEALRVAERQQPKQP